MQLTDIPYFCCFVCHVQTYFGMDVSAVEDPVQQRALETMIRTYGQTPRQLFTVPHPSRCLARSPSEMEATSAMGIFVQFAFRESHEVARDITVPVRNLTGMHRL